MEQEFGGKTEVPILIVFGNLNALMLSSKELMILAECIDGTGGGRSQKPTGKGQRELRIQRPMVRLLTSGWNYFCFILFFNGLLIQNQIFSST